MLFKFYIETNSNVGYDVFDYDGVNSNRVIGDDYIYSGFESIICDSHKNNINEEDLVNNYLNSGKKFILILNINPITIEEDANEEILYWKGESMRMWNDKSIDNKVKLEYSPMRDLKLSLSNNDNYILKNCKIFEDYSDNKFTLYFAVLVDDVEKI